MAGNKYEEKIKNQKQEWAIELTEKLEKMNEDKLSIESKYEKLKKLSKENDF